MGDSTCARADGLLALGCSADDGSEETSGIVGEEEEDGETECVFRVLFANGLCRC